MLAKIKHGELLQIIIALVILVVLLVPLFLLAQYATPISDDFWYANEVVEQMENHSLSFFSAALQATHTGYLNWQGTYFGSFIAFTNPFILYGEAIVPVAISAVIVFFCAAMFFCTRSVLSQYFHCRKWSVTLWIYTALMFLMTQFFVLNETFFWFNSAAMYTIPFCVCLIAFAFFAYAYRSKGAKKIVLISLSTFLFAAGCGGMLIINVLFLMLFLAILIQNFYHKKSFKSCVFVMIPFAVCIIFSAMNAFSPGNFIRQGTYQGAGIISAKETIWLSFTNGIDIYTNLVPIVMLIAVLLFVSLLSMRFLKNKPGMFGHPVLIVIFSLLTLFLCVVPIIYGYGKSDSIPPRYSTLAGFIGIGVAFFCTLYVTGWFINRENFQKNHSPIQWLASLLGVVVFAIAVSFNPILTWKACDIVNSYMAGSIQGHQAEVLNILHQIENDPNEDVVVPAQTAQSHLFNALSLNEDPNFSVNQVMAAYYNKDSVRIG